MGVTLEKLKCTNVSQYGSHKKFTFSFWFDGHLTNQTLDLGMWHFVQQQQKKKQNDKTRQMFSKYCEDKTKKKVKC
jgi:hypothetical protein